MNKRITQWLNRYGKSYNDEDFGYADCDMIDGCMHDLGLDEEYRKLVGKMVDEYIQEH